jgi:methionyl-tRNA formyltransferase
MNACEWSLLLGYAPAVTIHYINEGIDTGDILRTVPVPVEPGDNIDRMRDKCVAVGIVTLLEVVASFDEMQPKRVDDADGHRQCYVMAPVMREILEARLAGATRCRFVHPGGQTT